MTKYKLLTPGPLTTTDTVKQAMLVDHCTWDDDYKKITVKICNDLLDLAHCSHDVYSCVLMQGSGTFGVESVLSSAIGDDDKLLVITNGAYGNRIVEIARILNLNYDVMQVPYNEQPSPNEINDYLRTHPNNTHVAIVHCETTTGILNDLEAIAKVVKAHNQVLFVDAMSSFGGIEIEVERLNIDFIIASANKCIQGVPGFSFIIAKTDELMKTKGCERSLSLSLYGQWEEMKKDGKWRFTSPTHVVLAFAKALEELKAEGGISARNKRYQANMDKVRAEFSALGLKSYLTTDVQSPIITTFAYPDKNFSFIEMYDFIKARGFAIYPGKLLDLDTFRIGVIGEIYLEDIKKLVQVMGEYLEGKK